MSNLLKAVILILDELIIVMIALLVLWKLGIQLHPLVITSVVLITGLVLFIVYRAIRSAARTEVTGGKKSMIGLSGYAVTPLDPEGLVRARGELWKAECSGDTIDSQEEIVVISIQGLKLLVRRKDDRL